MAQCAQIIGGLLLVASSITVIVQTGFIDQIKVRAPILIGPSSAVDAVPWTFHYGGACNNVTLEAEIDALVTCPRGPPYTQGAVIWEFTNGCVGNAQHSNGPTGPLMGLVCSAAIVITALGVWAGFGFSQGKRRVAAMWIGNAILVGLGCAFYFVFKSYQAIEQCPPVSQVVQPTSDSPGSGGIYCDWAPCSGGPDLDHYSAGCTWHITNWAQESWVISTVLPQCPYASLDNSDPNNPILTLHAIPSPLVVEAINKTQQVLWIALLVNCSFAVAGLFNLLYVHVRECCPKKSSASRDVAEL